MAVTTENSTEYGELILDPPTIQTSDEYTGKTRVFKFTFTQGAAAGDANSLANLTLLPAGRWAVLTGLSKVKFDAFGSGRTLDIGHTGYTEPDGTAVTADVDAFADGIDVENAGTSFMDAGDGMVRVIDAVNPVVIQAKVLGNTIPAATKVFGFIVAIQQ